MSVPVVVGAVELAAGADAEPDEADEVADAPLEAVWDALSVEVAVSVMP